MCLKEISKYLVRMDGRMNGAFFLLDVEKLTFLKSHKSISKILDLNASNQFRTNSGSRREGVKF